MQISQQSYCQCVDSRAVYGHYETAVSQFYDKHVKSGDGEEKKDPAKILATSKYSKNYGTEDQPLYQDLPLLFYSLLRKYDTAAIEHIENRKLHQDPPRLMPKTGALKKERKSQTTENNLQGAEL